MSSSKGRYRMRLSTDGNSYSDIDETSFLPIQCVIQSGRVMRIRTSRNDAAFPEPEQVTGKHLRLEISAGNVKVEKMQ